GFAQIAAFEQGVREPLKKRRRLRVDGNRLLRVCERMRDVADIDRPCQSLINRLYAPRFIEPALAMNLLHTNGNASVGTEPSRPQPPDNTSGQRQGCSSQDESRSA